MIMVAVITMMTSASCDKLGWKSTPPSEADSSEYSIPLIEDSIKTHLVKQDSLYKGLTQQIDTLTNALNESKAEITVLKQQVNDQKELGVMWQILIVVSLLGTIIPVCLLVVLSKGKYLKKDEIIKEIKSQFVNYVRSTEFVDYINKSVHKTDSIGNAKSSITRQDVERIVNDRLGQWEKEINISKPSAAPVASLSSRVKYVKDLNSGYFTTLLPYNGEGCIFKIEQKSETEGSFTLLSLEKLKTVNGLTDFVEYSGNCKLEDATFPEVTEIGFCKKAEKDCWIVTKKLKIKISK